MIGTNEGSCLSNSGLSPTAPIGGREFPTNEIRVVSTRRRFSTNWVSGRMLQPSTEPVITNFHVPSDFLVEGKVSELGTVQPFLL